MIHDIQLHSSGRWERGKQVELGYLTLAPLAVGFILVEGHDFRLLIVYLQAGSFAPLLGKGNHRLELYRISGAKGEIVNIEETANPYRARGGRTTNGGAAVSISANDNMWELALQGADEVGCDDAK